jgi:hypothetical protein
MKKLRRLPETEVIAEFLKNEFYQADYHADRERFERVVMHGDLANDHENALRRALLFRRRGHMWRELPPDTQWWEMELEARDLERVRVFPRAQWRRVSNGSFYIADIVRRIREQRLTGKGFSAKDKDFAAKLEGLGKHIACGGATSSVMLIGIDDKQPLTILEGNHRLTAALLESEEKARTCFRVLCGLSPRMAESCWYDTNLSTLWHYAKNRFRNLVDKEADVYRVLATSQRGESAPVANSAAANSLTQQTEAK